MRQKHNCYQAEVTVMRQKHNCSQAGVTVMRQKHNCSQAGVTVMRQKHNCSQAGVSSQIGTQTGGHQYSERRLSVLRLQVKGRLYSQTGDRKLSHTLLT
jgi:hypothetical protein